MQKKIFLTPLIVTFFILVFSFFIKTHLEIRNYETFKSLKVTIKNYQSMWLCALIQPIILLKSS